MLNSRLASCQSTENSKKWTWLVFAHTSSFTLMKHEIWRQWFQFVGGDFILNDNSFRYIPVLSTNSCFPDSSLTYKHLSTISHHTPTSDYIALPSMAFRNSASILIATTSPPPLHILPEKKRYDYWISKRISHFADNSYCWSALFSDSGHHNKRHFLRENCILFSHSSRRTAFHQRNSIKTRRIHEI